MIIEMTKQKLFLKNIELTLFLEPTINTSEIKILLMKRVSQTTHLNLEYIG